MSCRRRTLLHRGRAGPGGSFAKSAADNGYDDVDAYLQLNFGKGVTTEIYHDYLLTYYTAVNYYKNVLYGESANALTDARSSLL